MGSKLDADLQWAQERIQSGLSSGEGLIFSVRDPIMKWDKSEGEYVEADHGVEDKRLLLIESELASLLTVMQRSGNTISPLLRNAWDGNKLQTMTRKEPLTASNAHISVIGHITEDELRARLTRTDMASGFANRFLFACVRQSKSLARGSYLSDSNVEHMGEELKSIVAAAVGDRLSGDPACRQLILTEEAEVEWAPVYHSWSVERSGLLATLTARAAPQTLRLAMLYALLDRKDQIDVPHLRAALAIWNFCEASADHIFGATMLGDDVADPILNALKRAGQSGVSRWEIRDLFGGHQPKWRIDAALRLLAEKRLGRMELHNSGGRGRPAEMWFALD